MEAGDYQTLPFSFGWSLKVSDDGALQKSKSGIFNFVSGWYIDIVMD